MTLKKQSAQKKSYKATDAQNEKMKKAEGFYLRKGFRSWKAVCEHLKIERSLARKSFLGISVSGKKLTKRQIEINKKLERFLGFNKSPSSLAGDAPLPDAESTP